MEVIELPKKVKITKGRIRRKFDNRICPECGRLFSAERKGKYTAIFCSSACSAVSTSAVRCPIRDVKCDDCGHVSRTRRIENSGPFRCPKCRKRARSVRDSDYHKRRRARKKSNGRCQRIISRKVFQRDGYVCQACGVVTNSGASKFDPLYPELDHCIPLSRGGTHTLDNVQCLCRGCNMAKSDMMPLEFVLERA